MKCCKTNRRDSCTDAIPKVAKDNMRTHMNSWLNKPMQATSMRSNGYLFGHRQKYHCRAALEVSRDYSHQPWHLKGKVSQADTTQLELRIQAVRKQQEILK